MGRSLADPPPEAVVAVEGDGGVAVVGDLDQAVPGVVDVLVFGLFGGGPVSRPRGAGAFGHVAGGIVSPQRPLPAPQPNISRPVTSGNPNVRPAFLLTHGEPNSHGPAHRHQKCTL